MELDFYSPISLYAVHKGNNLHLSPKNQLYIVKLWKNKKKRFLVVKKKM
jgi:hypothetical protein